VAGTVAGAYQKATIELYSGPEGTGTLLSTLEVDDKRNFFTTDMLDIANGVYAVSSDGNGNREFMKGKVFNGGCNLCHGQITDDININ
jgi:hypothetical protein